MISITRNAATAPAVFCGEKRKQKEAALLEHFRTNGSFQKDFWEAARTKWKPARQALFDGASYKCAYCETIKEEDWEGDVEHFRPKSLYWWLAFSFHNYLFACKICNEKWKKDQFPIEGDRWAAPPIHAKTTDAQIKARAGKCTPDPVNEGEGLPFSEYVKRCDREQPLLTDPYLGDPEKYFRWEVATYHGMPATDRFGVIATPRSTEPRMVNIVKAADRVLGINRQRLARDRYVIVYKHMFGLKKGYDDAVAIGGRTGRGVKKLRAALLEYTEPHQPYAGMARYFVYDEWKVAPRP